MYSLYAVQASSVGLMVLWRLKRFLMLHYRFFRSAHWFTYHSLAKGKQLFYALKHQYKDATQIWLSESKLINFNTHSFSYCKIINTNYNNNIVIHYAVIVLLLYTHSTTVFNIYLKKNVSWALNQRIVIVSNGCWKFSNYRNKLQKYI